MEKIITIYIIIINLIGFLTMKSDKEKAKARAWRTPEKTFFLIALLGGSIGTWAGMYVFHHKTKHWYFKFGMPGILLLQIIGISYILC